MRSVLIVGIRVNIRPSLMGRAAGAALVVTAMAFGMRTAAVGGTRGSAGSRVRRSGAGVAGRGRCVRIAVGLLIGAVTHIRRTILFGLCGGIQRKQGHGGKEE